jgi:hypothetical protein
MTAIRSKLKKSLRRLIDSTGYTLFNTRRYYARDGVLTVHNDHFRKDPAFQAAYARGVKASQGIDPQFDWRVHIALWAARAAVRLPGDFVECGVNAGFISSAIMQNLNWSAVAKRFYLIDTFNGPVLEQYSAEEVDRGRRKVAEDAMAAGAYVRDIERVRANFAEWPNSIVVQGAVPAVLPALGITDVAFLHIDLNCGQPEQQALAFFWDRLSPGALVLLDDYAYFGHECQARAIDEVARTIGFHVLSLPTGQGLIVK